jgi:nucleotide-binding universal stress UspA family protein
VTVYEIIVAGTDLSKTARLATDRAARLASKLGSRLVLLHAGRDPGASLKELAESYGAEALAVEGNPAEVLVSEAERLGAGLLVVGSVGMSGARRFMLGNVPNKVSHHATTDLLIVKTDPAPRKIADYERILVGTDGSPTATRAVATAAQLASRIGAQLTALCAYEPPSEHELEQLRADPSDPVAQWNAGRNVREVPPEFRWRIAGAAQAEDVLDRAAEHAQRVGVEAEVRAVQSNAPEALLAAAEKEGFELIVVGSVGMSGAKRFMLGNVPHRVSHHAPTDVLILRTAS